MGQSGTARSAATPGLRQVELSIGGMTCAACAARVEKILLTIPDVSAVVNFATEKAPVAAPASISVEQLVDVVRHSGYSAEANRPGLIACLGTATSTGGPDQEACACPG